jgi:hypothetical protein
VIIPYIHTVYFELVHPSIIFPFHSSALTLIALVYANMWMLVCFLYGELDD